MEIKEKEVGKRELLHRPTYLDTFKSRMLALIHALDTKISLT